MFQPPRGTRDYLPADQQKKNWVIDQVREVYESYGFEPLGTPAFENLDMLLIKSGDDIINQIYNFKDKSDRELALRFEHTASTVRVVATHRNLVKPFKRYTIGPVWRYERPTEKRFREFWQADVDIFGVKGCIADAEVLSAAVDALSRIGFESFTINLNDRRILKSIIQLAGIPEEKSLDAFRAVDKLGKIGRDGVIKELKGIAPYDEASMKLLDLIGINGDPDEVLGQAKVMLQDYEDGVKGCDALEELYKYAKAFGFAQYIKIDLSLARGLDYYTGPVFEVIAKGYEDYGSIAGGGRYDEIIELYGGPQTYATGVSFGVDRLASILEEKGAFADMTLGAEVYIAPVNKKVINEAIEIAQKLRVNGISTIVDMMGRKLGKQFEYADKKSIPKVVLVGERELAEGAVMVRDMITGEQEKVKLGELVSFLQ
ncbi:histidine--tRNA ligase [Candidatus Bathyarchaeota archaeon]|mgnify:CR=1 FL=1|jgi:histidyl-tRNA synthetase|nr:histidine--tRNA ligase [Candidatus Bathyarchaeota archaeon]MBT4321292.1 histidine--tRNA ligase [Candidatus Bathyarchaeota archaeon]MBT4424093.1 histidine--tRNA ligase [Candidatus Bathyarchaeota archaeon]MBT5643161.1 histidine--tRNA ligase [Candidatus Bathyarchaeota archaeon]MBT6604132.1 histidine--tRNA ligase [Candidatus Bathyarchaeota archaeon]